ncbi:MAG TPA: hypothetical protein VNG04_05815 [Candidatus Acidoferrum sp.]|nr:hypothetical protein [Candidatus Acidoferrum sp.]
MGASVKRPVKTMRRNELVAEAHRLGIKNPDRYNVNELRPVVAGRLRREGGR